MTIPFKQIPANIRVPLFYAEVDPSRANTAQLNQRALLIGQITSAGAALPNIPIISQGVADAKTQGGQGSILALMAAAYRNNDQFGELWYLPLADDGSAAAAIGGVKFTSVASAIGTLSLYIGGQLVSMPVSSAQTLAQLATALAAAINAIADLPVTAAVDGTDATKVDVTAKNAGLSGNDIDIRFNYQGTASGRGPAHGPRRDDHRHDRRRHQPDADDGARQFARHALRLHCDGDERRDGSLNALQAFLNDSVGRWSWEVQVYGHLVVASRGTIVSALTTLGTARNDQHGTIMGFYDSPTPHWKWAAAIAAQVAISARADPGIPIRTVTLLDVSYRRRSPRASSSRIATRCCSTASRPLPRWAGRGRCISRS